MYHLLIHEILHGIFALPFAIYIYIKTKNWKYPLALIAIAYLLDLDHLIDYWRHFGLTFNLYSFLSGDHFELSRQSFVYWHAWEWLVPLYLLSRNKKYKYPALTVLFAMFSHLILDSLNVGSFAFYSIIYRISQNFLLYS